MRLISRGNSRCIAGSRSLSSLLGLTSRYRPESRSLSSLLGLTSRYRPSGSPELSPRGRKGPTRGTHPGSPTSTWVEPSSRLGAAGPTARRNGSSREPGSRTASGDHKKDAGNPRGSKGAGPRRGSHPPAGERSTDWLGFGKSGQASIVTSRRPFWTGAKTSPAGSPGPWRRIRRGTPTRCGWIGTIGSAPGEHGQWTYKGGDRKPEPLPGRPAPGP